MQRYCTHDRIAATPPHLPVDNAPDVPDELITWIRKRRLDHLDAVQVEIEVTPVDTDRHPRTLAVVSAAGLEGTHAEPLSLMVGPTDDRSFWLSFFHDLRHRGLRDVRAVVSDEFRGLRPAVATVFPTARVVTPRSDRGRLSGHRRGAHHAGEPEASRGTSVDPQPAVVRDGGAPLPAGESRGGAVRL